MQKQSGYRLVLAVSLVVTAGGYLRAADQDNWRFWGVRDGLAETYTTRVTVASDGKAYLRHGAVSSMSIFDGYGAVRIPEARQKRQPFWPAESQIYTCPRCSPWVISEGELREFRDGRWVTQYSAAAGETLVGAVPTGGNVVLFAARDARQYVPATRDMREIQAVRQSRIRHFLHIALDAAGQVWVAGEH